MKILTLNICNDPKLDNNIKYHAISNFIIDENIDIVVLQEVFQSKSEDIAYENVRFYNKALLIQNIIGQKGGRKYHEKIHMFKDCWNDYEEGIAILSKYPILKSHTMTVSNITDSEHYKRRDILSIVVEENGSLINITNAHLGWDDETEKWTEQFDRMTQFIDHNNEIDRSDYVIIAGDFNIGSNSKYYEYMLEKGYHDLCIQFDINNRDKATYKNVIKDQSTENNGHIDYIITNQNFVVRDAKYVLKDNTISDHIGIMINVSIL